LILEIKPQPQSGIGAKRRNERWKKTSRQNQRPDTASNSHNQTSSITPRKPRKNHYYPLLSIILDYKNEKSTISVKKYRFFIFSTYLPALFSPLTFTWAATCFFWEKRENWSTLFPPSSKASLWPRLHPRPTGESLNLSNPIT
jgi:hypothetical protein